MPLRREASGRAGYECEFVEPPPKHLQSECPICLLVLREPHLISCCGYIFCASCIQHIGRDGKPCPLCNEPGFTTMANKSLKRTLYEFRVYCPHRLHSCEWAGELGKLDEHLNSDPKPRRQLEGCPFSVIECFHCKEGIRRDEIADHLLERCPQRPYTCEYCAEYKSTFEDVVHCHWPECKCFLLPCPNECTPSGPDIERQHLDQHVKEECPLTIVQCVLHYAGCEVTLPRRDMADHMKEDFIAHLTLLAAENYRLSRQNTELEETATKQSQELVHAKDMITFQAQELERVEAELKEAIDRLHIQQQCELQELRTNVEVHLCIVPVTIKMTTFNNYKKLATSWYSQPFYTSMGGYKMCLSVDANGCGRGEGTHVSVFTCLMPGEFDSQLKWPFRGSITFQLVNQLEDKKHKTGTISYTRASESFAQVTDGERSSEWGKHRFIRHSQLGLSVANNRQYLKDDCIIFRIMRYM